MPAQSMQALDIAGPLPTSRSTAVGPDRVIDRDRFVPARRRVPAITHHEGAVQADRQHRHRVAATVAGEHPLTPGGLRGPGQDPVGIGNPPFRGHAILEAPEPPPIAGRRCQPSDGRGVRSGDACCPAAGVEPGTTSGPRSQNRPAKPAATSARTATASFPNAPDEVGAAPLLAIRGWLERAVPMRPRL